MDNGELTYEIIEKAIDKMKIANEKSNTNGSVIIEFDILKHLVDTIDSQKAEIEILKNIGDNKTKELLRYDGFIKELHDKLKTAKAEAIKEYTEKLEAKLFPLGMVDSGRYLMQAMAVKKQIDGVKEKMLKGGDNDETKR